MTSRLRHSGDRKPLSWLKESSGQSLIEGGLVLPFLVLLIFGVVELGVALRDQHAISRLSREGSNLISRDVALEDAADALTEMRGGAIDFDVDSKLIFSVVKRGATVGTTNYNRLVLYQRFEYGRGPGSTRLATRGGGSFGSAPEYVANNSDTDSNLQVTNAPSGLVSVIGGLTYVTEIITAHPLFAPLARFGVQVPQQLYAVTYF